MQQSSRCSLCQNVSERQVAGISIKPQRPPFFLFSFSLHCWETLMTACMCVRTHKHTLSLYLCTVTGQLHIVHPSVQQESWGKVWPLACALMQTQSIHTHRCWCGGGVSKQMREWVDKWRETWMNKTQNTIHFHLGRARSCEWYKWVGECLAAGAVVSMAFHLRIQRLMQIYYSSLPVGCKCVCVSTCNLCDIEW